jgi:hypothetical protein
MGHYNETWKGVGKTVREAESDAVGRFFHENGHRCNVRGTRLLSSERVPPKKWAPLPGGPKDHLHYVEDKEAPQSEWVLSCEFDIAFHC